MSISSTDSATATRLTEKHFNEWLSLDVKAYHFGNDAARRVFTDIARLASGPGSALGKRINSSNTEVIEHNFLINAIRALSHVERGVLLSVMLIEELLIVSIIDLETFRKQVKKVGESKALLHDSITVRQFNIEGKTDSGVDKQKVLVDDDHFGDAE